MNNSCYYKICLNLADFKRRRSIKKRTKNEGNLSPDQILIFTEVIIRFQTLVFFYLSQLSAISTMEAAKKNAYVELIQMTGKVKFVKNC